MKVKCYYVYYACGADAKIWCGEKFPVKEDVALIVDGRSVII